MRKEPKVLIGKDEKIVCAKCGLDITTLKNDPYIAHDNWTTDDGGHTTCTTEEYIICPNCGREVTLATWNEEF